MKKIILCTILMGLSFFSVANADEISTFCYPVDKDLGLVYFITLNTTQGTARFTYETDVDSSQPPCYGQGLRHYSPSGTFATTSAKGITITIPHDPGVNNGMTGSGTFTDNNGLIQTIMLDKFDGYPVTNVVYTRISAAPTK